MNDKPVVLKDNLSYRTYEIIRECARIFISLKYLQEKAKARHLDDSAGDIEHVMFIINLISARTITLIRIIRFLIVGLIVTNSMWYANLMGWI